MAWKAPGAGDLRDRISVKRPSQIIDDMGATVDDWETIATNLPAKISDKRGSEQVQSERLSGLAPADIVIRRTYTLENTVSPDCIIVDDRSGKEFAVKWIGCLEDGRKRFLILACVAGEVTLG